MNLKYLIITIFTFLYLRDVNAQSKKEQIVVLSNKIDSLNSILNNERSMSLEKITKLNSEIDLISKKLIAANDELTNASKDLDKKRVEAASFSSENKRLESDLTSLKEENSMLQLQLDSIVTSNLGIEMVFVEGGTFQMGSNSGDSNERPVHKVALESFYIGKFEVTHAQWRKVMGEAASDNYICDDCPVDGVSAMDIDDFIHELNFQTGKNYRLPTESEWEFAARGGVKSQGYIYSGSSDLGEVGWFETNSFDKTHSIGQKKPNELGIYDMSGNVSEWCQSTYYPYEGKFSDEDSEEADLYLVLRGGAHIRRSSDCRSTSRDVSRFSIRESYFGFRLVLPYAP
jgi:formylglycine-generating enzyme required for sulfatase activity